MDINEILNSLKITLEITEESEIAILTEILNDVISEVKTRRRYPASMTTEQIDADLQKYSWVIKKVASGRYDKLGASSEDGHSENGVNRTFTEEAKLLDGIVAFATLF
jgi:hypothetical protein